MGVTGVKNNERFARADKANVNGKRPLDAETPEVLFVGHRILVLCLVL
jgi:hypothetical protein